MYCSNCGITLNANLNYCNSCGTRVENKTLVTKNQSPVLGIGAVFIGLFGLVAFYPLLRELLHSSLDTSAIIVILVAYLLTVFAMFGTLILQGRRNTGEVVVKGNRSSEGFGGQEAFRGINTAQLHEHREPVMSVTDHTTKTLDKVPIIER